MYHRAWQAIKSAHDDVQDKVLSFTDIFAPEVKVFDILGDILIPIITVGIGVVGEASSKSKLTLNTPWSERVDTDALHVFQFWTRCWIIISR